MKTVKLVLLGGLLAAFGSCKKAEKVEGEKEKAITVSTISGGPRGYEDGPVATAAYNGQQEITFDPSGNLFVVDRLNQCIRKITPQGVVSTFAGTWENKGYVDGPGATAQFNDPYGIVVDKDGNLYISDGGNNCIRKITAAGVVSTFAGSTQSGYADGTGAAAKFTMGDRYTNNGLAMDVSSNLYLAEFNNNRIRKITPAGVVTTVAGNGTRYSYYGTATNGPVATANLGGPGGIAVDKKGNIYFTCGNAPNSVRKISTDGVVTTYAGSLSDRDPKPHIIDGPAGGAMFSFPVGLEFDADGNLYVADSQNQVIRKVTPEGTVSTLGAWYDSLFALPSFQHVDGDISKAKFCYPKHLAFDKDGNLYVSQTYDQNYNYIRKLTFTDKEDSPEVKASKNWNKPKTWK